MDARGALVALAAGGEPSTGALRDVAARLGDGRLSDAQAGAFAMGVFRTGLSREGRVALTEAMRDSGRRLTWDVPGPVLDKHSTGGIGDCVSLVLAPALAAVGAYVPMISGRGLGHTGGTLDKLEAIPGLSTELAEDRFRHVVTEAGCAIVAASRTIAPADRRLYAVRDETETVAQADLITASILAKKLAAGLDSLVLDVKVGRGAFMATKDEASGLAERLVETARGAGCPAAALLTAMDEPLAPAMGNAVEVTAALDILAGGAGPLRDVASALGGRLMALGGLAETARQGEDRLIEVLEDGRAMERFVKMTALMGGPGDIARDWARLRPMAAVRRPLRAAHGGYLAAMDGRAMGSAVVALGAGRRRASDAIDPAVGLSDIARCGTEVAAGDPLCTIHAADEAAFDRAAAALGAAIRIADAPPALPDLILAEMS